MWQKTDTGKHRTVKLWMLCAEVVEKRDTLRKSVSRLNVPHIPSRFHKLPPVLQGQGLVNPLYFDDDGQPIFTHMVSVSHANKHLIKFPIALDYTVLKSQTGDSTTPSQTVLLKADMGADINLMNRQTFSQLFGKAATDSYQEGKLWKCSNKSAWNFLCISEMERQGLQTTLLHY